VNDDSMVTITGTLANISNGNDTRRLHLDWSARFDEELIFLDELVELVGRAVSTPRKFASAMLTKMARWPSCVDPSLL